MIHEFDLHLSAMRISADTIAEVERFGFCRDEFANNTRCVASAYHATYRGSVRLPDDRLWASLVDVLQSDPIFCGCLEEEAIDDDYCRDLRGSGDDRLAALPPILIEDVPPGQHKACDLHIGIDLMRSTATAVRQIEALQIVSFDKPTSTGIRRVYTLTCQTRHDGVDMLEALTARLNGCPGLYGKIKLETTTRHLRHPADAPTLPITSSATVQQWIAQVK